MPRTEYHVTARSKQGRLVEQDLHAASEAEAVAQMRNMGLTPIAVESRGGTWNRDIHLGRGRVRVKDLAVVSRQLATMLSSGVPLLRCLAILAEQTESRRLAEVLEGMRVEVEKGSALSEAMSRREEFPPLMVSMTKAGEVGGFLDVTMEQIANSLEADVQLRGKIKAALTYPIAVAVIAVLITAGMLMFIVPVFAGLFDSFGGSLPLPTQILVDASNLMRNPLVFGPFLIVVAIGFVLYRKNARSPRLRAVVDPLKFRIPIFGPLMRKVALARFSRNLSALLAAGVPILTALDIVADTSGNVVVAEAVHRVQESVRQGSGIARPLGEQDVFPSMVVQMIAVGEDSGDIDTMLAKVADFYDQEVEASTEQLMALIEPLMIVVLGGLVGGMIVAMYLPIFNIFELLN